MAEHQRKIELQSPADLLYLRTNIEAAAQRKLDLHLPPHNDQPDALRPRVEPLIHHVIPPPPPPPIPSLHLSPLLTAPEQYIHDTLRAALPSLSINGLDDSAFAALLDPDAPADAAAAANYEPYDDRLAARLRDTHARLEAETTRVAQLRREAPGRAAAAWAEGLRGDVEARERAFVEARERVAAGEGVEAVELGDVKMERPGRVRRLWDGGRRELEGLKGVTEVVARLERAKRAVEEVERR